MLVLETRGSGNLHRTVVVVAVAIGGLLEANVISSN